MDGGTTARSQPRGRSAKGFTASPARASPPSQAVSSDNRARAEGFHSAGSSRFAYVLEVTPVPKRAWAGSSRGVTCCDTPPVF